MFPGVLTWMHEKSEFLLIDIGTIWNRYFFKSLNPLVAWVLSTCAAGGDAETH